MTAASSYVQIIAARCLSDMFSLFPAALLWRVAPAIERVIARFSSVDHWYVVRRQGLLWELNPGDYVCSRLFWFGVRDWADIAFILANLEPAGTVIDAGANFGYYSLLLGRLLGPRGTVHAFEPHPVTFRRLERNIARNAIRSIRPHQLALGDTRGEVYLDSPADNTGSTRVTQSPTGPTALRAGITELDSFAAKHGLQAPIFVKLDVEGHETSLLRGASRMLATTLPPLMVEVSPSALSHGGHSVASLLAQLRGLGYTSFRTCAPAGVEQFGEESFAGGQSYRNVFCTRSDSVWTNTRLDMRAARRWKTDRRDPAGRHHARV